MPIIATAGHVDHGKSTLIRALTGRDPDRWAEEKRRGLTIDLGFAWADLEDLSVGFVDVPGHERFVKNMLAGVGVVDAALLVVAADEGWMPQTEEHMGVLDVLGVRFGVVAVTRTDLADTETVAAAVDEVAGMTAGTVAEHWPVVPLSAISGAGIDTLGHMLGEAVRRAPPPEDIGTPRMWIDRAFSIEGAGTVVTGTLTEGALHKGMTVDMWPGPRRARVRRLQAHERDIEEIAPGNRAAVNLAGITLSDVGRGAMLSTPRRFRTTDRILADVTPMRGWAGAIGDRGAFHVHVGTGHVAASVRLLDQRSLDRVGPAVVGLAASLPLRMGDRFVVRDVGRRAVVAGGVVLDPHPGTGAAAARTAPALRAALGVDRNDRADALLAVRGRAEPAQLIADTGGAPTEAVIGGAAAVSPAEADRLRAMLRAAVDDHHRAHPLRPGISKASLASASGLDVDLVEVLVHGAAGLVADRGAVRSDAFTPAWDPAMDQAWQIAASTLRDHGLAVPRRSTLGLDDEAIHTLIRRGSLIAVGPHLVFLRDQLDDVVARLDELPAPFTVADFRDHFGVTRRQAVPLLEWLDAGGHTSRRGSLRTVRRRQTPPPDAAPPR